MDLEEEGRAVGAVATDAEDGDDGVCVVVVVLVGGCLYLPWPSNSPSSEPSSTDKTLIAAPCSKDHFYSNCSEAEMEVIQRGHVVGWRQMHTQHLYSSTFAWLHLTLCERGQPVQRYN